MTSEAAAVAERLAAVRARIEAAARAAGRDPLSVRLVAVSKTFGPGRVRAAAEAGVTEFGENRVQEAMPKIAACSDLHVRWHLVGHLQSNKARKAAAIFACVHSVDSAELLQKLEAAAADTGARPDLLVQVDLAGEAAKHGAPPAALRDIFESAARCRAARVIGLMLLPPLSDDPEEVRPYFRRLRALRDDLVAAGVDRAMLSELSMGMSHDFEVAVQEGATLVRIGTAIFGPRQP